MKKLASAVMIGLAALGAQAQDTGSNVRWFGSLGASFGGDTLASGTYTNGQSFAIKAGEGVLLSGGLSFPVTDKVDLLASVGYQYATTNATNGSIKFTRMPIELLAFYNLDQNWRLGGGVRSATGAKLTTSGVASVLGSYDFTPSLGAVLEAQYLFAKSGGGKAQYGMNFRYVSESFEENSSKTKVNGNGLGLGFFIYY